MKEVRHVGGTIVLDDTVADALQDFAVALADCGMSATVSLQPSDGPAAIEVEIGRDRVNGKRHILHAKPTSSEGSHLGLEDL